MSSSSDLEQQVAAALRRVTPVAAAPAVDRGGAPDLAAAIQRRMASQRARGADAFYAKFASARSLADQTFSRRRVQLKGLKDQLRDLHSQLRESLTLQSCKEWKYRIATEPMSEATATNERLRSWVADFRDRRNKGAAIVFEQLQAVESLEANSNEDAEMVEKVPKAVLWYNKFLGFRVIGGERGVKFVFDKIDPQRPEKEYSFRISPRSQFIDSDPHAKDIDELAKDLDLNEHLFKFVRMAREKFQSPFMNETLPVSPDASAAPLPSPMVVSVNSRSGEAHSQTQSLSKNSARLLPAKRGATALPGASPGVLRRSPRLEGMR